MLSASTTSSNDRTLGLWLLACCLCVALMVAVGGYTRLSDAGLSIVQWKPLHGTIPPIGEAEWREEFQLYQQTPQYKQVNHGMSLEEFKGIFWVEYAHRLAGRVTGFVFLLPFLYFLARGRIGRSLGFSLAGIFMLGGLQGALGWYMVASGLVDVPWVSPLRLAMHLGLAFILFGLLFWVALRLLMPLKAAPPLSVPRAWSTALLALVFIQILLGALVAGLDAGLTYNTFPLMDGRLLPEGLWLLEPAWRNLVENVTMVQFLHRVGGVVVLSAATLCWLRYRRQGGAPLALLVGLVWLQFALGIATLLLVVPMGLALLHQSVALLVFASCLLLRYRCGGAALRFSGEVQGFPAEQALAAR